MFVSVLMDVID